MAFQVMTKNFEAPPVNPSEIFRYAFCGKNPAEDVRILAMASVEEALPVCSYKVCYVRMPIIREEGALDLGFGKIRSEGLYSNLEGCNEAVIFAATIGIGMDRLISKYGRISPSKSVMMQAIGAERIEALCDAFNMEIEAAACSEGKGTVFRYSPGYRDFSLTYQRGIFDLLKCNTAIGLSLNDSMLMSPSKSVTAIIGISEDPEQRCSKEKCERCDKKDCEFRFWEKR